MIAGQPVLGPAQIDERVALANTHFGSFGICFDVIERPPLPEVSSRLTTIRDRHALGRRTRRNAIDVFLVGEMLDATPSAATRRAAARVGREPTGRLSGAHIPIRGHQPGTYLIVVAGASTLTLTHELGHFFGEPHHRDPLNIMSYGARRERFEASQGETFRRIARRLIRTRALRPTRPCPLDEASSVRQDPAVRTP